jgi:hypothetical protein
MNVNDDGNSMNSENDEWMWRRGEDSTRRCVLNLITKGEEERDSFKDHGGIVNFLFHFTI